MIKKVTKTQLREILSEEIREIVREEVQYALQQFTQPQTIEEKNTPSLEHMIDLSEQTSLDTIQNELASNPSTLNDLIHSTSIPDNYYQGTSPHTATSSRSPLTENETIANVAYRPERLQEAQVVDGKDLNNLENTDFSAFME